MALKDWDISYRSDKLVRWRNVKNEQRTCEVWKEYVDGKYRWFTSIDTGKSLADREMPSKKAALALAIEQMKRRG